MIDFHKAAAGGFATGVLILCVLAISTPASARGGSGGANSLEAAAVPAAQADRASRRLPSIWTARQAAARLAASAPSPAGADSRRGQIASVEAEKALERTRSEA